MRNFTTTHRALIVVALLFGVAGAGQAEDAWREPLEPSFELGRAVPGDSIRTGADPCSCLRELRACLISAYRSLGRCLSHAHTPARQALCYLKFELDVVLCLERAGACELTCVP